MPYWLSPHILLSVGALNASLARPRRFVVITRQCHLAVIGEYHATLHEDVTTSATKNSGRRTVSRRRQPDTSGDYRRAITELPHAMSLLAVPLREREARHHGVGDETSWRREGGFTPNRLSLVTECAMVIIMPAPLALRRRVTRRRTLYPFNSNGRRHCC